MKIEQAARVVRAIRKYHGVNQVEFCKVIDVQQGTLSKIEAGKLELSAAQWLELCSKYSIDPNCLMTGQIEAVQKIKIDPNNRETYGNFKVHKKYKVNRASTVRTVYPFVAYMERKLGVKETREFLKSLGVDSDYFVIQNLPINIKIIEDIFQLLCEKRLITPSNTADLLDVVPTSEIHHYILNDLKSVRKTETKFERFVSSISKLYEANSLYKFEGDDNCFVKVRENDHMKEMKLGNEFLNFREIYNLLHFNRLAPIFGFDKMLSTKKQDNGWDIVMC